MFSTRIMFSIQFHIIVSLEISTWYACSFRLDNFMKMRHRHQYAAIDPIAKLYCTSSTQHHIVNMIPYAHCPLTELLECSLFSSMFMPWGVV